MARPNQEAIETFMSITGASEAVAVRKLEEHRGDLNEAVNAYFSEGDRNIVNEAPANISQDDAMDIDNVVPAIQRESLVSPLSPAGAMGLFSALDPNFGRSLFDRDPLPMPRQPSVTRPRDVRQIPIEVKDGSELSGRSGNAPTTEDVTGIMHAHEPSTQGAAIIDEESGDDIRAAPTAQRRPFRPNASAPDNFQVYNDIEEEMIRAAIEASKKDAEGSRNPSPGKKQSHLEDDDLAQAVTMSLKSAEQEKALHNQGWKASTSERGAPKVAVSGQQNIQASNGRSEATISPVEDDSDDVEEQPLVRHRSRRVASGSQAPPDNDHSRSPEVERTTSHPPDNGNEFPSEWGGISPEEHDEAVMLEAAMFGGIPESGYNFPYAPRQNRTPRPPSPSVTAQRLIREQQDDEYNASLQADREKEMKAIREAESRRLEEEAAKRAAIEEEKKKEEEVRRKLEEEQELERQLAAKEASLPREPPADEENAVTLLVRMPDGTRRGRRFLKSDKLESLFDFIDTGRVVKPGTYRLVRPYPRRAFGDGESASTLNDLGLTSKQEALFLELI